MLKRYRRFRLRFVSSLPRYRAITGLTPIGKVLDFGCGEGYLGRTLQAKGCEVTGCDISPNLLARCPFPTRQYDLNGPTDFEGNEFDTVVASDVLEHLSDVTGALAEMKRIARRFVIISVPNSKKFLLYKLLPSMENPHERYSPHLHHWGRGTFPMPDMALLELVYCTDIPELRFLNLLRWSALSQTIVMKFDVGEKPGQSALPAAAKPK